MEKYKPDAKIGANPVYVEDDRRSPGVKKVVFTKTIETTGRIGDVQNFIYRIKDNRILNTNEIYEEMNINELLYAKDYLKTLIETQPNFMHKRFKKNDAEYRFVNIDSDMKDVVCINIWKESTTMLILIKTSEIEKEFDHHIEIQKKLNQICIQHLKEIQELANAEIQETEY